MKTTLNRKSFCLLFSLLSLAGTWGGQFMPLTLR